MPLNPWRLRLLEVFSRTGTVRAVAAELHLSASTVSQQFAVLESETGAALFERSGRSIRLTPTGALLAGRARELRDHLDAIEAELLDAAAGTAGRLRLGGFASSVEPLLIEAVRSLAATHPRLAIEVLEIEPRESADALHRGLCDVMVTVDEQDGTLQGPAVTAVPLAADPLLVVLPAAHPAAALEVVPLEMLEHEAWALDLPGTYLGELVPRHCRRAGFEPRPAGRFSSYPMLLAHVAAGLSVAVLPALAAPPRAGIARRPTTGFTERRIAAAVRTPLARRPDARAVLDALRVAAAQPSWWPASPSDSR